MTENDLLALTPEELKQFSLEKTRAAFAMLRDIETSIELQLKQRARELGALEEEEAQEYFRWRNSAIRRLVTAKSLLRQVSARRDSFSPSAQRKAARLDLIRDLITSVRMGDLTVAVQLSYDLEKILDNHNEKPDSSNAANPPHGESNEVQG